MSPVMAARSAAGLIRRARRALQEGDYRQAQALYAELIAREDDGENLDLRLRHAFCAERAGDVETARAAWRDLVEEYERLGEPQAAARLRERLASLRGSDAGSNGGKAAARVDVPPLSEAELAEALFALGRRRRLRAGEVLCHKGDVAHGIWLLESGEIEVVPDEEYAPFRVRRAPLGITVLGETGLFTRARRSASLVAVEPSSVIEVEAEAIERREAEDPAFAGAMARLMRRKWLEPALARHEIFARINDIDRRRIAAAFRPMELAPGEELVAEGGVMDAAFLLQQGCLFYMHDADEGEAREVVGVMPGDVVHLGGLLPGYASPYRIVAATPARVMRLDASDFAPFLARRPWLPAAIESFRARPAHRQLLRPEDPDAWREGETTMEVLKPEHWGET
ncbi:MAG: cyclic nucleotide-binding domain-containing protein [Mariprofundaceae bacterium]